MFGANSIGTGLTLGKVFGGLSKTLSIANQVIPLYQQVKPMVKNARSAFAIVKEFGKSNTKPPAKINSFPSSTKKQAFQPAIKKENNPINRPTFFV